MPDARTLGASSRYTRKTRNPVGIIAYGETSEVALKHLGGKQYNDAVDHEAPMSMSPFLSVRYPCQKALVWVNQRLAKANFRSVQTFDLQEARIGSTSCTCPHHGTEACDCQMIVLLVYGNTREPVSLILHGNDGQTWLTFGETPRAESEPALILAIQETLGIKVLASDRQEEN